MQHVVQHVQINQVQFCLQVQQYKYEIVDILMKTSMSTSTKAKLNKSESWNKLLHIKRKIMFKRKQGLSNNDFRIGKQMLIQKNHASEEKALKLS